MDDPEPTSTTTTKTSRSYADKDTWSHNETEILLTSVEKFNKITFRYGSIVTHPKHAIDYILENQLIRNKSRQNIFMKYKNLMRTYRKILRKNSTKNLKFFEPDRFPFFQKIHGLVMKYQGPECIYGTKAPQNDFLGTRDDLDAEMLEHLEKDRDESLTAVDSILSELVGNSENETYHCGDPSTTEQELFPSLVHDTRPDSKLYIELEEKCTQTMVEQTSTTSTKSSHCNLNLNDVNSNFNTSPAPETGKSEEQLEYFRAKTEYFKIKAQTERGKLLAMKKFIEIEEKKLELLEKMAENRETMHNVIGDSNDDTLEDIIKHLL